MFKDVEMLSWLEKFQIVPVKSFKTNETVMS